jgi:hypothetical protein
MKKYLKILTFCLSFALLGGGVACQSGTSSEASVSSSRSVVTHTVTFENYDDSVLLSVSVPHLGVCIYTGATPTRPADDDYLYTFDGWDKESQLREVTSDLVLHALYDTEKNAFEVVFYSDNSEQFVLQKTTVHYGAFVTYAKDLPFANQPDDPSSMSQTSYRAFDRWDFALESTPITANTKIHPLFKTVTYASIFQTGTVASNGTLGIPDAYGLTRYLGSEKTLVLPSALYNQGIVALGDGLFKGHRELQSIVFYGQNLKYIHQSAFENCSALTDLHLPEGLLTLDFYAFRGCASLTLFSLPKSVTTLGYGILSNDSKLSYLDVTSGSASFVVVDGMLMNQSYLGVYAYCYGDERTTLTLPKDTLYIYEGAFEGALNLEKVTLPADSALKSLYGFAFAHCPRLTRFDFPASVTNINSTAFAFDSALTSFDVASGNATYLSFGSKCLIQSGKIIALVAPGLTYVQLIVPSAYDTVGDYAAYGSALTKALIGPSITRIENQAFASCYDFKGLDFAGRSQGLTFGDQVFADDGAMSEFAFPNYTTAIGKEVFLNCISLANVSFAPYDGTSFSAYLTTLGDNPFKGCEESVVSVVFPSSSLTALPKDMADGAAPTAAFFTTSSYPDSFVAMTGYAASGLSVSKTGNVLFYSASGTAGDANHRWWHFVNNVPTAI